MANHFDAPDWDPLPDRRFQFGDLRIETVWVSVVVETESAGGLTNLVK